MNRKDVCIVGQPHKTSNTCSLKRASSQRNFQPSSFISVYCLFISFVACRCKGLRHKKKMCGKTLHGTLMWLELRKGPGIFYFKTGVPQFTPEAPKAELILIARKCKTSPEEDTNNLPYDRTHIRNALAVLVAQVYNPSYLGG